MTIETPQYTIGGSEAAVVLGVSTWGTPLSLYLEKKGLRARPDLSHSKPVKWGRRLEEAVAQAYAEDSGRVVQAADPHLVIDEHGNPIRPMVPIHEYGARGVFLGIDDLGANFRHPEREWQTCHPDRFILDPRRPGSLGILEAKTAMYMKKDDWGDEPPLAYQVQLQHNIEVMVCGWGSLAVLIGGNDDRWQDQDRDEAFIAVLVEKEADFIRRLNEDDPPDPIGSEIDRKSLSDLFGREVDQTVALPPEAIELDERLANAIAKCKEDEAEKILCENLLKQMMGAASIGVLPGGRGAFSWKTQERKEYVVAATSFRAFRRLKR